MRSTPTSFRASDLRYTKARQPHGASMLISGKEKLERMRDGRVIYIGAERVDDVTRHPAFRKAARTIADLYDFKADPDRRDLFSFEENGERYGLPWLRCRTREDLVRRMRAMKAIADATYGLIGRSPDHVAGTACRPRGDGRRARERADRGLRAMARRLCHAQSADHVRHAQLVPGASYRDHRCTAHARGRGAAANAGEHRPRCRPRAQGPLRALVAHIIDAGARSAQALQVGLGPDRLGIRRAAYALRALLRRQFDHRAQPERPRGAVGDVPCHGGRAAGTRADAQFVAITHAMDCAVERTAAVPSGVAVTSSPPRPACPPPTIRRARSRSPWPRGNCGRPRRSAHKPRRRAPAAPPSPSRPPPRRR